MIIKTIALIVVSIFLAMGILVSMSIIMVFVGILAGMLWLGINLFMIMIASRSRK